MKWCSASIAIHIKYLSKVVLCTWGVCSCCKYSLAFLSLTRISRSFSRPSAHLYPDVWLTLPKLWSCNRTFIEVCMGMVLDFMLFSDNRLRYCGCVMEPCYEWKGCIPAWGFQRSMLCYLAVQSGGTTVTHHLYLGNMMVNGDCSKTSKLKCRVEELLEDQESPWWLWSSSYCSWTCLWFRWGTSEARQQRK